MSVLLMAHQRSQFTHQVSMPIQTLFGRGQVLGHSQAFLERHAGCHETRTPLVAERVAKVLVEEAAVRQKRRTQQHIADLHSSRVTLTAPPRLSHSPSFAARLETIRFAVANASAPNQDCPTTPHCAPPTHTHIYTTDQYCWFHHAHNNAILCAPRQTWFV